MCQDEVSIFSGGDHGGVVDIKVLEEETQVNNQVLGQKSLAQLFLGDVEFTTPSGVVQSLLFAAGYILKDF